MPFTNILVLKLSINGRFSPKYVSYTTLTPCSTVPVCFVTELRCKATIISLWLFLRQFGMVSDMSAATPFNARISSNACSSLPHQFLLATVSNWYLNKDRDELPLQQSEFILPIPSDTTRNGSDRWLWRLLIFSFLHTSESSADRTMYLLQLLCCRFELLFNFWQNRCIHSFHSLSRLDFWILVLEAYCNSVRSFRFSALEASRTSANSFWFVHKIILAFFPS